MKYRIRKPSEWKYIYYLERESIFGWLKVFHGCLEQCNRVLDNLKKTGSLEEIVRIEEI